MVKSTQRYLSTKYYCIIPCEMLCNLQPIIEDIYLVELEEKRNKRCRLVGKEEFVKCINLYNPFIIEGGCQDIRSRGRHISGDIDNILEFRVKTLSTKLYEILIIGKCKISICGPPICNIFSDIHSPVGVHLYFHSCTSDEAKELYQQILTVYPKPTFEESLNMIILGGCISLHLEIYKNREELLFTVCKSALRHGFDLEVGYFSAIPAITSLCLGVYPLETDFNPLSVIDHHMQFLCPIYNGTERLESDISGWFVDMRDYSGKILFMIKASYKHTCPKVVLPKFGLVTPTNPIIDFNNFGKDYIRTTVGISNERRATLLFITKLFGLPDELCNYICDHWLNMEIELATNRLLTNQYQHEEC